MSEREDAIRLANRLLDEPNADPDDDLRTLARQLLRASHRAEKAEAALDAIASGWKERALAAEAALAEARDFIRNLASGSKPVMLQEAARAALARIGDPS